MTDAQLVGAVRTGEREAFAELVDRYKDRVVAAAYHIVGDRDTAEDLAQDTFVEGFRQIHRLREPERVGAWLHGIVQRLCYKYLRRASRSSTVDNEHFEAMAAEPDLLHEPGELCHLLNDLPPQYKEVLAARYLEDLEYEEIAEMLNTTVNNVRVRCHRAKNKLRELLEQAESARASERAERAGLRLLAGQGGG